MPRTHVAVEISIAADVAIERHGESDLPVARPVGDAWMRERRTAVLMVPSVVARKESNVLLNPRHPDFGRIRAGNPEAVIRDARLFGRQ